MRIRALILSAPTLFAVVALLSADEPPKVPPSRTVGSVYGKVVTAADIGLTAPIEPAVQFDARDEARWKQMGRITTTFGGPVVDRFVKRKKIEATLDEIEQFSNNSRKMSERNVRKWEARLAELKQELAAPNLSDANKAKLQKDQGMYEQFVAANRKPLAADESEQLARMSCGQNNQPCRNP